MKDLHFQDTSIIIILICWTRLLKSLRKVLKVDKNFSSTYDLRCGCQGIGKRNRKGSTSYSGNIIRSFIRFYQVMIVALHKIPTWMASRDTIIIGSNVSTSITTCKQTPASKRVNPMEKQQTKQSQLRLEWWQLEIMSAKRMRADEMVAEWCTRLKSGGHLLRSIA